MTGCAVQPGMLAFEWEFGVLFVVELCLLPALFCVAGVTFLSVTPTVLVIVFMAAVAVLFGFYLVYSFFVTGLTDSLFVFAFQREVGITIMLEFGFNPIARAVTVFALVAIAPIVDIVQGVAGIAVLRCLLISRVQVAAVTGNFFVFSQ